MLGKRDKEDNFSQEVMEQIIDVPVRQVAEQIVGVSVSRVQSCSGQIVEVSVPQVGGAVRRKFCCCASASDFERNR